MNPYDIDAEWIREEHGDLIAMMNDIYDTLIELRYFRSEEILRPPYGVDGKPPLDKTRLGRLGFTDEVMALMEQLPYPSSDLVNKFSHQDEGVPLAPDSSAVSYLDNNHISTARQPFCDGEVGIPAWAFKVVTGGFNFGNSYIYDTRLKHIVRWDSQAQDEDYSDQPTRPPADASSIMVGELRTLDWLPWRVQCDGANSMNIYSRPTYKQHMSSLGSTNRYSVIENDLDVDQLTPSAELPTGYGVDYVMREIDKMGGMTPALKDAIDGASPTERCDAYGLRELAIEHDVVIPELPKVHARLLSSTSKDERVNRKMEIAKAVQNRYMYKRNLYNECGWSDDFNGDEFERLRGVLEKEHYDLMALLGPQAMRIQNLEEGRYLREWYRQKAGCNAAC